MMNKFKIAGYLLAVLALIGVGYKLAPVNPAETKTVFVDRVVVKDRILTKDVVRTETRPDGTKIITQTAEHATEHSSDTDKSKTVVVSTATPTHYSLGVGLLLNPFNPLKRGYQVELGKRLWDSPFWGTVTVSTRHEFTVGVRVEF